MADHVWRTIGRKLTDAFHLEREREFKRLIRAAHPDRNHCNWAAGRTRKLLQARARWEKAETRWYARLGLDPPKGGCVDTARQVTTELVPFIPRLPGSN